MVTLVEAAIEEKEDTDKLRNKENNIVLAIGFLVRVLIIVAIL
jgi:hypothetical protein